MQTVFDALGEPNRRAILGLLAQRELSVGELEQRLELPQPLISKHLRVLRESGVVRTRPEGRRRLLSLREDDLSDRFPGLLEAVLSSAKEASSAEAEALL